VIIMSNSLFKDALADAKKLREVAEQNAKNSIIESIAPKIREMIEKQILGDFSDLSSEEDIFESDENNQELELTAEAAQELQKMLGDAPSSEEVELAARRLEETVAEIALSLAKGVNEEVLTSFANSIESLEETKLVISEDAREDEYQSRYSESWNKVDECKAQIEGAHKATVQVEALQEVFEEIVGKDAAELQESDLNNYITLVGIADTASKTLKESLTNFEACVMLQETFTNLLETVNNNNEELKAMKRSLRDLLSEEKITIELDLGEDVEVDASQVVASVVDEDELELEGEPADEDEADEGEVEGGEVEVEEEEEEEVEAEGELEEEVVLEVDENDLEEALAEMVSEMAEGTEETEDLTEDAEVELTDDTVIEISESMLRDELAKLRTLNEEEEVEEETLNETEEAQEMVAEEQNDQLNEKLEAYQGAIEELKGQLGEVNLFNAKLLYTNKLLMNSDLTQAQRARAIESLDEARSLREVKLLFKTLSESFNKRSKESVNESKRVVGTASRATRPAGASLNESSESNRWALLAGINK